MFISFKRTIVLGLFFTLFFLISLTSISFFTVRKLNEVNHWVGRTQLVLRKTNLLARDLAKVEEAALVAFFLAKPEAVVKLKHYELAAAKKKPELAQLLSTDQREQRYFNILLKNADLRSQQLKRLIIYKKKNGFQALQKLLIERDPEMYKVRYERAIEQLLNYERRKLAEKQEESKQISKVASLSIFFSAIISTVFLLLLFRFINKTFKEREQDQHLLKISENTFSSAFHHSGTGIALVAPDGHWLDVNDSLCRMVGYSKDELLTSTFQNITHPDDLEADLNYVRQVLKGEISSYSMEKRYLHKNGSIVWAVLSVSLLRDTNDLPRFFIAQVADISENKRVSMNNQTILDASIDVICAIDEEGRFSQLSRACLDVWGYTPEELLGKKYMDYVIEEDHPLTEEVAAQIISGTAVTNFENHYRKKDGSIVPIIWSARWDFESKTMFCIAKDGSEKKRLQVVIEEEREKFRDLFQAAPSCIAILEGPDHIYKFANPLYCQVTGKSNLIGKSLKEVFPETEAQGSFERMARVFKTGEAYSAKEGRIEIEKNNSGVLTTCYFDFAIQPYKNYLGEVEGIFIFFNEVTAQVEARQKIETSQKRYAQLIEELPGAVYTCDVDGRIELYNRAAVELWGKTPDLEKDRWCAFYETFDTNGVLILPEDCAMALAVKKGEPIRGAEATIIKPNGERRDIKSYPIPLLDPQGRVEGGINMIVDITSHKQTELALRLLNQSLMEKNKTIEIAKKEIDQKALELEQSNQYKSEFLANMSHELRTPLNAVLVLSHLLAENAKGNLSDKEVNHLKIINKGGADLLTLINDILDLSKIEAGRLELERSDVLVATLVRNMEHAFFATAEEKGIRFEVNVERSVPDIIHTDLFRLEQIVKNLLSNAFKFTNEGKVSLNIAGSQNGSNLCIQVSDTGIGIEDNKKQVIFDAFRQANGTTTREYGGTGLGLSISKELALKFGGSISVESIFGKGSVFSINIPITSPKAVQKIPDEPANVNKLAQKKRSFGGKKLLIVDDDIVNIYALSSVLEEAGIDFYSASNGVEALSSLEAHDDIDLVVMDMMMPEMDGYEATRRIRGNNKYGSIPIIALTARAMVGDAEKCLEAGVSDYISKPFSPQHLVSQIKFWIEKSRE